MYEGHSLWLHHALLKAKQIMEASYLSAAYH